MNEEQANRQLYLCDYVDFLHGKKVFRDKQVEFKRIKHNYDEGYPLINYDRTLERMLYVATITFFHGETKIDESETTKPTQNIESDSAIQQYKKIAPQLTAKELAKELNVSRAYIYALQRQTGIAYKRERKSKK